jgi:Lrp/AsnC family transcriptional regulator, regulator for asnA, asnC and gidA
LQRNPSILYRPKDYAAPADRATITRVTSHERRNGATPTTAPRSSSRPGVALDDVSKSIIEQLQQDGRRSYASIGKAVGLSEAAVRQRVQRLTEAGVMQIVAVTDPLQLGFGRQAMVGIHVDGAIQPVADALAAMDEVIYVVMTAGTYDVLCEVVSTGDEELLDLVSDRIRSVPGVRTTETFVYLKLAKQTYSWGVR